MPIGNVTFLFFSPILMIFDFPRLFMSIEIRLSFSPSLFLLPFVQSFCKSFFILWARKIFIIFSTFSLEPSQWLWDFSYTWRSHDKSFVHGHSPKKTGDCKKHDFRFFFSFVVASRSSRQFPNDLHLTRCGKPKMVKC